jgi:hypothetical protein
MTRTLNELDPPDWGPAPTDATGLVTACHAARQKPLRDLTVENLRVLIGQNIALPLLIPLAKDRLRDDPLSEGDFYPGDLLKVVLTADPAFWHDRVELAYEIRTILDDFDSAMQTLRAPMTDFRATYFAKPS